MIKVNLLPVKRRKKPKPIPAFLVWAVILLILAAVVVFYGNYYMNGQVAMHEEQKRANEEKIKRLNETIKEVKDFESLNKTFTERKDIIEKLTLNQSLPARILDEMSERLTDGVWLMSMNISEDLKIELSGVGFSTTDIVTYVQSLKNSPILTNVELIETSAEKAGDVDTFRFRITLMMKV